MAACAGSTFLAAIHMQKVKVAIPVAEVGEGVGPRLEYKLRRVAAGEAKIILAQLEVRVGRAGKRAREQRVPLGAVGIMAGGAIAGSDRTVQEL
jgi:hypothetical protein